MKLWGGRFEGKTDKEVEAYTHSLFIDARLWQADLQGTIAHVRMLGHIGVLTTEETEQLTKGLLLLGEDLKVGKTQFDPSAEDVHSEIERLLTERLGDVAGKIHTARSRNDQVTTATRLYLRNEVDELSKELSQFQKTILALADTNTETVLPGTTHLQHAQPVSLSHHLMAYFWMLQRDRERLSDARKRINELPLGSGALAGTSFPLDRERVMKELGFEKLCENSLDAVSDRDFVLEFLNTASLIMLHLSRFAEEMVLWSTPDFGFVELSDSHTTGSSMMPQKKNPDVAELIRGKVGRLTGAWVGMATTLKALPLSYNRDLQEDKTYLFEGLDTVRASVRLAERILSGAKFKTEKMAKAIEADFSNATDLADFLVKKGMPFRKAHEVTGHIVRACIEKGVGLEALTAAELQTYHSLLDASVIEVLKPLQVMKARISRGGTSPTSVKEQIKRAREAMPSPAGKELL